jgi:tetratricopeptide (TPR) repeat protein
MMSQTKSYGFVLGLALLAAALGCSETEESPTDPILSSLEQAWSAFESGDFAEAESKFNDALAENATDTDAHNGLGWAHSNLGQLGAALSDFDAAISGGHTGAAPHVGRAIVLRDLEPVDYDAAITSAEAALSIDAAFQFSHDASVDWRDLRLVIAQSHFALGNYAGANEQVGLLGGVQPDPSSGTFVEDLLAEIERLGTMIGA